jgi:serine/threonine protein kinase/CheY-like chemotaxis protein
MGSSKVQRFGPYVILDRIGDGGMAEIFLAKVQGYSGFEKLIALKKIHPRYSENQTFAQMLIHEAKLAASLQHFNVVQVYDLGEIEGQVFIGMEYVRGRDLAAVLSNTYRRKEKLPLALSLCIATEFMTGLDYAHRMRSPDGTPLGIIHRDISPQNVLISYEGEVKVTDFGIARVIATKSGFQLPGNLHGKFGYMSPEQVLGHEIDQRSDIFSAGVVLWEMLTGTRLFRNKDHKKTIKMIVSHAIPPPSTVNPEVPPSVDRICAKALSRDRTARYQTMGALLGELSRVADTLPRRAATRDLAVYMRRQFGTAGGGYTSTRSSRGKSGSAISAHSGFGDASKTGVSEVSGFSMTPGERIPLGQILIEQGSMQVGDLEIALAEQRARGGRIGELLVASGTISEDDLVRALSMQSGFQAISETDLLGLSPPIKLLKRFPREAADATLILPISINEADRSVGLSVVDPYDERAILETKVVLGVQDVVVFVAKRSAVRAAITKWYVTDEEPVTGEHEPIFEPPVEMEEVGGPPVVLFADADEASIAEVVDRVREEECEVLVATDGKKARDLLRERRPSVAFLDAALPGIDGYNLLLELRGKNEDAAVFITSNRGDDFRQAKALELGADDFIVKPFSVEITASKIRREVQKRSSGKRVLANPVKFDGVSGSLKDMTALDIAQSLELGRKSAHVVLQYEEGHGGDLGVRQGQIVGAVCGPLVGEEAFYQLMKPGAGLFRIEYRASTCAENITKPNTYLMIEAMRRIEEESPVPPANPVPTSSRSPLPIEAPPMRSMRAPESGPAHAPLFAGLADDLVLEAPVEASVDRSRSQSTPVGAELANALEALIEEHLEQRPTEVVRMSKPTTPSDYQKVEGPKVIGKLPLKRRISDKG